MLSNSYLLIDTAALAHNVNAIREDLHSAKLVAVIKGNAYGLGAVPIAHELEKLGVDAFAVSHVAEGLELRRAGINSSIMVMSLPLDFQTEAAAEAELLLTLGSFRQFEHFRSVSGKLGRPLSVQLKLDTGLHRIGFVPEELPAAAEKLREYAPYLRVVGTFSHFADTEPEHMDEQLALFLRMIADLNDRGVETGLRHISSSASLEADTKYNLDAVRVGRRLYMDSPTQPDGRIRECASFRAFLTDIRPRKAGETLSYGNAFHLPHDADVGVLSIGYGDGWPVELAKSGAPVLVNGQTAHLLADCMDQSFVDVTGIDCAPGDEVTLFGYDERGNLLSSQAVAARIGDNEGCGLTDALGTRVERIYR